MKRVLTGLAALFAVALLTVMAASSAFAVKAPHVKVDVCHATGSQHNPYVLINVNVNSVGVANDLNGHAGHAGDIWAPFVFDGVTYPGQGDQSILANGCKAPNKDDTPPIIAPAAALEGGTCDVPGVNVTFDNSASVDGTDGDHDDNPSAAVTFTVLVDGVSIGSTTVNAGEVQQAELTAEAGLKDGSVVTVVANDETLASLTVDFSACNPSGGGDNPPPPKPPKHHCKPAEAMQGKCQLKDTGVTDQQVIEDSGSRVQGG